jgi:hypothetical protein
MMRSLSWTLPLLVSCAREPCPNVVSIAPLPSPAQSVEPAPIVSATPKPMPPGTVRVDKTVAFDDVQWVVIEARDAGQSVKSNSELNDEEKRTTGRFVMIHYKLTNLGKKEEMLLDRPKVQDDRGREFGPIDMESFYVPVHAKTVGLDTIQPSLPKEYWTVVEVAPDATHLKFVIHGFSLTSRHELVELGI